MRALLAVPEEGGTDVNVGIDKLRDLVYNARQ
jgi:hypothetical protein